MKITHLCWAQWRFKTLLRLINQCLVAINNLIFIPYDQKTSPFCNALRGFSVKLLQKQLGHSAYDFKLQTQYVTNENRHCAT